MRQFLVFYLFRVFQSWSTTFLFLKHCFSVTIATRKPKWLCCCSLLFLFKLIQDFLFYFKLVQPRVSPLALSLNPNIFLFFVRFLARETQCYCNTGFASLKPGVAAFLFGPGCSILFLKNVYQRCGAYCRTLASNDATAIINSLLPINCSTNLIWVDFKNPPPPPKFFFVFFMI